MGLLDNTIILAIVAALAMFTLGMFIFRSVDKDNVVRSRVKKLERDIAAEEADEEDQAYAGFAEQSQTKSGLAVLCDGLLRMTGVNMAAKEAELNMRFAQAGISSPNALPYYLFMKRFGLIVVLPILLMLLSGNQEGFMKAAVIMVCGIVLFIGVMGADMYLKNAKTKRQKFLVRSFPDALDLILVCVEAGLALDAALSRVCKELAFAHPVITKELNKTRMELTLLNDRPRALQNLAERTDLVAFRALVGSLLQSEKFGTSLTETLRVLAEDYRHERLMAAETKAGRLPALITIPLMLFLMPALFLIILSPALIKLFHTVDME